MKKLVSLLLAVMMLLSIVPVAAAAGAYPDVVGHWGQEPIEYWSGKGVVSGYTDGTFQPDKQITRAEVAQILKNFFNLDPTGAAGFPDVAQSAWYQEAVLAAQQNGVLQGYEDGTFRPNSFMTREEVIVMLRRVTTAEENMELGKHFADYDEVCDWAKGSVGALREVGVLDGYNRGGTYYVDVHRIITRAEFVKLLFVIDKSASLDWKVPGTPITPVIPVIPGSPSVAVKYNYFNVAISIARPEDGKAVAANSRYADIAKSTSTKDAPVLADVYQTLEFGHGANASAPVDASGAAWNYVTAFQNAFDDAEAYEILKDMIKAYQNATGDTTNGTAGTTWAEYVNGVTVTTHEGMAANEFVNAFLKNVAATYNTVKAGKWDISFTTPVGNKTYVVTMEITMAAR